MPLLGKLGCNGRGGFRLSLFGYDPAADYAALATPQLKQLKQLEGQPAEIVETGGSKAGTQLRAIAHWEDGSPQSPS